MAVNPGYSGLKFPRAEVRTLKRLKTYVSSYDDDESDDEGD
jgi:hypothetical protein